MCLKKKKGKQVKKKDDQSLVKVYRKKNLLDNSFGLQGMGVGLGCGDEAAMCREKSKSPYCIKSVWL